jgi:hypothetical protein
MNRADFIGRGQPHGASNAASFCGCGKPGDAGEDVSRDALWIAVENPSCAGLTTILQMVGAAAWLALGLVLSIAIIWLRLLGASG